MGRAVLGGREGRRETGDRRQETGEGFEKISAQCAGKTQRSDSFFPVSLSPASPPPVSFVSRIDFLWIGFINFHTFALCGSDGNMERRLGIK
jgi:hypothetical protein